MMYSILDMEGLSASMLTLLKEKYNTNTVHAESSLHRH